MVYLIHEKLKICDFFATNCQNINFPWGYFLNVWSLCINKLLFHQKKAKFASNCQNMNLLHCWFFCKMCDTYIYIFISMLLFHENQLNLRLSLKYELVLWLIYFKCKIFLQKYIITLLKIGIIHYFTTLVVKM